MVVGVRLRSLPLWLSAGWCMSLTTLGFMVVPLLFANLPTPSLAGNMAARLFSAQTVVSATCAMLLLLCFRSDKLAPAARLVPSCSLLALGGALLALLVEFGVAPHIVARDNLALWHRVGSAMYFVQWLCAMLLFGKLAHAASALGAEQDV